MPLLVALFILGIVLFTTGITLIFHIGAALLWLGAICIAVPLKIAHAQAVTAAAARTPEPTLKEDD